jgi:hypothetical protein
METFSAPKELLENPHYLGQREHSLRSLDLNAIDVPLKEMIRSFAKLPYCFTLQCCFGHFLYTGQVNRHNLEPLPVSDNTTTIEYKIAYVAVCIENSRLGKELLERLGKIPALDPEYIQFGCAEWFWARQVNSYALQVEPQRFKDKDTCVVAYKEALHLEKVKQSFFIQLNQLIREALSIERGRGKPKTHS